MSRFRTWLARAFGEGPRASRRKLVRKPIQLRTAPVIELLEDRSMLAVQLWDGGGSTTNWSDAANWVGDIAPAVDDNLVFGGAGTAQLASVNDYAAGTRFRSLTFVGGGYSITGNAVALLEGIAATNAVGTNAFAPQITLAAPQTFIVADAGATLNLGGVDTVDLQLLTVDGSGSIAISGQVTGTGGITKTGTGTLSLSGANSYEGITTVNAGVVNVSNSTGLGSTAGGTTVAAGAAVQVQGSVSIAENIDINGNGVGVGLVGLGALRSVGGANTWSGTIQLAAQAAATTYIGVDTGSTLNVSGAIAATPTVAINLVKVGGGQLALSGTTDNMFTGTFTALQGTTVLSKTGGAQPFHGALTVGDNLQGDNASVVRLTQADQIPTLDFTNTTLLTTTINSSGLLDLNGVNDAIGALTMVVGTTFSGDISTGAGTLSLGGNVALNNFQGSSGTSPAATISGKLDLGTYFSGGGALLTRTFTINDTALASINADLTISANISGAANVSLTRAGGGTMTLSGTNTYLGQTILTAGIMNIGSDSAFGGGLLAIGGATLAAVGGAHTVTNTLSFDGSFNIYGANALNFTGPATLTAARTITILDPSQVTTMSGGIDESIIVGPTNLGKSGRGTLVLTGANNLSGVVTINDDGGVLSLRDNGTLLNATSLVVNQNATLRLDNTGSANLTNRLNDFYSVTLGGGRLQLIGAAGGTTKETVGILGLTAALSSTVEVDTSGGGTVQLNSQGLVRNTATSSSVNFVATGADLSTTGAAQINFLSAPPAQTNGILAFATVSGPSGFDFATWTGTANGAAILALPAAAYTTSLAAATATSNVKLTASEALNVSKTVNSLLIVGAGVAVTGTAALTIGSGAVAATGGANSIATSALSLATDAVISTDTLDTLTVGATIVGAGTSLAKAGAGKLVLTADNPFAAAFNVNQGVVNIQRSNALGAAAGATVVRQGTSLELQETTFGAVNVSLEPITVTGLGFNNTGALRNVAGLNNTVAGAITLAGNATDLVALTNFPAFNSVAIIDVAAGTKLALTGAISGAFEVVKTSTGTLEYGGSLPNTYSGSTRVLAGTLVLNKPTGVNALAAALFVGDDLGGAGADVVRYAADHQIADGLAVQVNSSGLLDLNNFSDVFAGLTLVEGSASSSVVTTGTGILTPNGNIALQLIGGGNATGASISGNLALSPFSVAATVTRTWLANDGAAAVDLDISAAILDGSDLIANAITKTGFGTLQFSGTDDNTYTGLTTINEGTLLLNKAPGVDAMSGPLTVGDGAFTNGGVNSDVVRWLASDQLPDAFAAITVNSTGLLDLNGFDETLGVGPGQNALTLTAGNVSTGVGTLTLNGEVNVAASIAPATISGNLDLGSTLRTFTVASGGSPIFDLIVSANISGGAGIDLIKAGTGTLLLTGNNTYTGRTYINNAGVLAIGSDTAFGTGPVYATSATFFVEFGPHTISNPFFTNAAVTLGMADSLTLAGPVTMTGGTTWTVSNATFLNLTEQIGDSYGAQALAKSGSGFMVLSNLATYGGATTINGGALVLRDRATALNSTGFTVNQGGTLVLDNLTGANLTNRVGDVTITLSGGALDFIGAAGAASSELVAGISLTANFSSTIISQVSTVAGSSNVLTSTALTRNAGSTLNVVGAGAAVGSATNQVRFVAPPALTGNILPYATLTTLTAAAPPQLDFVQQLFPNASLQAAPFVTSVASGVTTNQNVKLTGGTLTLSANTTVNGLLLSGGATVVVNSGRTLTVTSGTVISTGGSNTISGVGSFSFGATEGYFFVDTTVNPLTAPTLTVSVAVNSTSNVTKDRLGTLILSANNGFTGNANVLQGALNAQNSGALGSAAGGTTVTNLAALWLQGGGVNPSDSLIISGSGISGTGALRNISGNNAMQGGIDLRSTGTAVQTIVIGSTTGTLDLSGQITGSTNAAGILLGNALTKAGLGTVSFSGSTTPNIYTGATTVSEGTLILQKDAGQTAIAGALVVGDNAGSGTDTVQIARAEQIADAAAVTINSTGLLQTTAAAVGTVASDTQLLTIAATTGTFTVTFGGQTTTGVAFNAAPATLQAALEALSSIGAGNVIVTGATSIYTIIFIGTLANQHQSLITVTGGTPTITRIADGGVTSAETVGTLTVVVGPTGGGSATLATNSILTLGGAVAVNAFNAGVSAATAGSTISGGTLNLLRSYDTATATRTATVADLPMNDDFVISSAIADGLGFGGALTKAGAGRMVLSPTTASTYTGVTTVSAGELNIRANTALGATVANEVQTVTLTNATGGTFTLTFNGQTTGTLAFNAAPSLVAAALNALSTIGGVGGIAQVASSGSTVYTVAFLGTLAGADQAQMTADGTALTGTSPTIAVATTTNGGAAAGTVVSAGALQVQGNLTVTGENLSLAGTGVTNSGALRSISGTSTWTGAVTLTANSNVGVDAGSLTLSGAVTGAFTLTKFLPGTLVFAGTTANNTGLVTVSEGTLQLNKTAGVDAIGTSGLTIGNDAGGAATDAVTLLASNQINDTATVTVIASGLLNLSGQSETLAALSVEVGPSFSASVTTGAGTLTMNGNVTLTVAGASTFATNSPSATLTGLLNLGAASRTFTIADALTINDLVVSATISNGGVIKTGAGTMVFSAANSYAGGTQLQAGTMALGANGALGSGAVDVNTGAASIRGEGTAIALPNAVTLNNNLTVAGNQNFDFTNLVSQQVAIRTITVNNTGTTTFSGSANAGNAIDLGNFVLTITANARSATTISGIALDGASTGGITKAGIATLTLSGANTYKGVTTVSAGVLVVNNTSALGTTAGNTVVAAGGELRFQGTGLSIAENITVAGVGFNNQPTGAIRMVDQNSAASETITLTGTIALTAAASIGVDGGGATPDSLTFTGVVSGAFGLSKVGLGVLQLAGTAANTYSLGTFVNQGTLQLNKTTGNATGTGGVTVGDALGGNGVDVLVYLQTGTDQIADAATVTVLSSGLFNIATFTDSITSLVLTTGTTYSAQVSGTTGTIGFNGAAGTGITVNTFGPTDGTAPAATISANLALGAAARILVVNDTYVPSTNEDLVISGVVSGPAAATLAKNIGAGTPGTGGTVAFTNANTYAGATTINAGQITLRGAGTALSSAFTINTGGTLLLDNTGTNNTDRYGNAIALTLGGGTLSFVGNGGTASTETIGAITLAANTNSTIQSTSTSGIAATLTSTSLTRNAASTVTFVGAGANLGSATNRVIFTTAPALTGAVLPYATIVSTTGQVDLVQHGGNGTSVAPFTAYSTGNINSVAAGSNYLLDGTLSTSPQNLTTNLTLNAVLIRGTGLTLNSNPGVTLALTAGTIVSTAGNGNTMAVETLDVGANGGIFITNSDSTISSQIIGAGGVTKAGTGTLLLNSTGVSSYAGATLITAGTVTIRNSTAFGSTAAGTTVVSGAALEVDGGLTVGAEALTVSGTGLTSNPQGVLRALTGTNVWGGNITLAAASAVNVLAGAQLNSSAIISGAFALAKNGGGLLEYSGASGNTYSGLTTVNEGTLRLNKSSGNAISTGGLTIGDNAGGRDADLVVYGAAAGADQIANTSAITINISGKLDLNGASDTLGAITMNGGTITTGAGTLSLNGNLTSNAGNQATISGILDLGNAVRTITVADGFEVNDLAISALVTGGTSGGIIKAGNGTLLLSGNNTFQGTTTHSTGTLALGSDTALGTTTLSIAAGTIRPDGGDRTIANVITSMAGTITFGGRREFATPNQLTFTDTTTPINLTGNLTINIDDPAIATTFSVGMADSGGSRNLFKTGNGTLVLAGASTFTGAALISNGTVQIRNGAALGVGSSETQILSLAGATGGTFTLTFRGQTIAGQTFNVSAATLQSALQGLSTIGSGNLLVTLTGSTYLLQFAGTLAGQDLPLITVSSSLTGGASGAAITPRITVVAGAELDFDGTVADVTLSEKVGFSGLGYVGNTFGTGNNVGAIRSLAGSNTIGSGITPIVLGTSTNVTFNTVGVDAGQLRLNGAVLQSLANQGLNKVGDGTLVFAGTSTNTYSGQTTVNDGTLVLQKSSGLAINGALVVGDNDGAGVDLVQLAASEQVLDSAAITVNATGQLAAVASQAASTTNETQAVAVNASGGTFTITFNGQTTAALAFNATDRDVQTALNGLTTIGGSGGSVSVSSSSVFTTTTGLMLTTYYFTFLGTLAALDQPAMTATSSLTGTGAAVTVTTLVDGATTGIERVGAITMLVDDATAADINLDTGTTLSLTNNVTVNPRPGREVAAGGALIDGTGTLALTQTAAATRTFTVNDTPADQDLEVATTIINGSIFAGGVTKAGAGFGRMVISGTNAFTGLTTASTGILTPTNIAALGAVNANEIQTVTLANATGGTFTLTFSGQTTTPLNFNATADEVRLALNALSNIGGVGGFVTVTASGSTVYTILFQGTLANTDVAALTATSSLTGATPTVTIATPVNGGPATAGTSVTAGAVLELPADLNFTGEALTLNGNGIVGIGNTAVNAAVVGSGALRSLGGTSSWAGTVALAAGSTVGIDAGQFTFTGVISGANSLTKVGTGTLVLGGTAANIYTGNTVVNQGTLLLSKPAGVNALASGTVIIGDGIGSDVVRYLANDQVATPTYTINSSGLLDLNNFNETAGAVNLGVGSAASAALTTGAGTFTLGGNVLVYTGPDTTTTTPLAAITGNLSLAGTARTFTVTLGAPAEALDIVAPISASAAVGITKTGYGTMRFDGTTPNTYTGLTQVSQGGLSLAKPAGVNAFGGNLTVGDDIGGRDADVVRLFAANQIPDTAVTIVASSGLLDLNANNETLGTATALTINSGTLSGGDLTTGGATLTILGNVTTNVVAAGSSGATVVGTLDLGGATRTFTVADNLTTVPPNAFDLDIQGAIIVGGFFGILKTGPGTMRLSGNTSNTYPGTTNVDDGTLLLAKTGATAIAGPLVIGNNATANDSDIVRLAQPDQIADTASITITSSGLLDLSGTDEVQQLFLTGATGGTFTLTFNGQTTAALAFNIATTALQTALEGLSTIGVGNVVVSGGVGQYVITFTRALAETNVPLLTLNAAALTPAATNYPLLYTVVDGVPATGVVETVGALTMNPGAGFGADVVTGGGTLTLGANVTIVQNGTGDIGAQISGRLDLGSTVHTLDVANSTTANPFDLNIVGTILGTGGITKTNTGTLQYAGTVANIYTGTTTVAAGDLFLNKTAGVNAIVGPLVVGDDTGGAQADVVRYGASDQIADTASVTVTSSGLLNLSGFNDVLGPLTLFSGTASGAAVTTGAGTLTLGGDVTLNVFGTGAIGATVTGNLALGTAARTFTINDGAAANDLDVSAIISGTVALTKSGPGQLQFSGTTANVYNGLTTVADGVLLLNKTAGVNALAGPVIVGDDAGTGNSDILRLGANDQIPNGTSLNVASTGVFDLNNNNETIAALTMSSGDIAGGIAASGTGTLTLGGDVTVVIVGTGSVAAKISGTLNLGALTRTFFVNDGAAAIDLLLPAVVTGGGGLTKDGDGTIELTAANSYSGTTTIVLGVFLIDSPGSLSSASAVIVNGGTLGGTGTANGTLTTNGGDVSPGTVSPTIGILNVGSTTLGAGSNLNIELNGNVAGTSFDQLNVTGSVNINGATLNIAGGLFAAVPGQVFVLINNDGTDAISGTFAGLPEGTQLTIGTITGIISYIDGPGGNDCTFTVPGPFRRVGDTLFVTGSGQDDVLTIVFTSLINFTATFTTAPAAPLTNNYSTSNIAHIIFNAGAGNDVTNFTGNTATDVANLSPDSLSLTNNSYTFVSNACETNNVIGAANDAAIFFDSTGDDTYTGQTAASSMSGNGWLNTVTGIQVVTAYATAGGNDTASVYDSSLNDVFSGAANYYIMQATGVANTTVGFDTTYAYSVNGGTDQAYLHDGAGDDTFTANPTVALMQGSAGTVQANNFRVAYGMWTDGGNNTAYLTGSTVSDQFNGFATFAQIYNGSYIMGTSNLGANWATTYVSGGGGTDSSSLFDSPGNDVFTAYPNNALMQGTNRFHQVFGFSLVYAYSSSGGADTATFYDSVNNDAFYGSPTLSYMFGSGYTNAAVGFAAVYASFGNGGADSATLIDSASADALFAQGDQIQFTYPTSSVLLSQLAADDSVVATTQNNRTDSRLIRPINFNLGTSGNWQNTL